MEKKTLLKSMGFSPKENTNNVFCKKYSDNIIEVDFEKKNINYGEVKAESQTTQNFSQEENWVVLECVNRLLEKGYKTKDITLEKVFPSGHGHSGRLDIFVEKDGKAFLMIECKTWGKEFEKEFSNTNKNGGQLFTYFQNDKNADFLMLYASKFDEKNNEIEYKNEIVVIDESYKETANVKDLFERWNKQTKDNGVFENWSNAYNFESRALQMQDLKDIKQQDSSFIFNRFLEILRHNAVSDKGNSFNKIFTLFLCKVKDEDRNSTDELDFQWKTGEDTAVSFQKRLSDLYRKAMKEFLDKEVSDFSDNEFNEKYSYLSESDRKSILEEITKVRLQKNNEFAIKDVFDKETFEENNIVLKEVIELLQPYKFRYNKKQPFLGEFFELLLTTGLKQESGQFFTPVPIARFICKAIPLKEKINEKLHNGERDELLPNVIDYAAGSGHFLTESMEEIQNILEKFDPANVPKPSKTEIAMAQTDPFGWAYDYVYGIERDYRLVKTTKVGCYLHGDGVANVIHGDGLDSFSVSKKYKGKLKTENQSSQENGNFDFVLSNPPYSVSSFKSNTHNENFEKDFELYKNLTDQSSEIEALFIERTKQLLKEGGIAALILPASILSNSGIYTKAREIILKYFDIISIVELGSNTFMATGTSTVTLFLRRRNNYFWKTTQQKIEGFFDDQKDKTINGIENIFSKYVSHVFEDEKVSFTDYQSLIAGNPNENIKNSEFFGEYLKKIKEKNEIKKLQKILEIEKEKLLYFVLAYQQEIVLVNSGQKKAEKQFLGYEFSNRRNDEGLHPINRRKSVDECTSLYDENIFDNPKKASTYILEAFEEKPKREIDEDLKKNISRVDLVDMLTFDRVEFEKSVNLNSKKKVKIKTQFPSESLDNLVNIQSGLWKGKKGEFKTIKVLRNTNFKLNNGRLSYDDIEIIEVEKAQLSTRTLTYGDIILEKSGGSETQAIGRVVLFDKKSDEIYSYSNFCSRIRVNNKEKIIDIYLWIILNYFYKKGGTIPLQNGVRLLNIDLTGYKKIKIPLPPKEIQQKIVNECEKVDSEVKNAEEKIEDGKKKIKNLFESLLSTSEKTIRLSDSDVFAVSIGKRVLKSEIQEEGGFPIYSANVFEPFGYIDKELLKDFDSSSVLWGIDGDWMVNVISKNKPFYPTDHCGYLRVKTPIIEEKYLAYVLHGKGIEENFSRVKRASIEKIKGIKIPLPPLKNQQKIVAEIEKIEEKISENQKIIDETVNKKEEILKKYL